MPKETEEARDERKRTFIEALKESKCRALVEPLHRKTIAYLEGEIPAEDLFKTIHYVSKESNEITAMFKKRPDVILAGIAMEENLYVTEIRGINVKVRRGDLTVLFVDAIVNPASPDGTMAAGVAAAIKNAGGGVIEEKARAAAPIAPGTALMTEAGSLPTLFVIHAPTVDEPGGASSPKRSRRRSPPRCSRRRRRRPGRSPCRAWAQAWEAFQSKMRRGPSSRQSALTKTGKSATSS